MMSRPEAARLGIAELGAIAATAAAAGGFWAWNYALEQRDAVIVVAAFVGVAIVGTLVSAPVARRLGVRSPVWALIAAVLMALSIVPALVFDSALVARRAFSETAPTLLAGLACVWVATLVLARLGRMALALGVGAAVVWAFVRAPVEPEILPAPPTVAIASQAPLAKRVIVIGIDSGDWAFLDPMLAAGDLPNLARLLERGRGGVLRSTDPSASPVVWTSIFTGKTPEKHGISDWYGSHNANLRVRRVWRLIEGAGLSSVVVNVPGTWPPRPTHGVIISGFPIPALLSPPPSRPPEHLGLVLSPTERPGGSVPTVVLPVADGEAAGTVLIGEGSLPRRTRMRSAGIEILERIRALPPRTEQVKVRFTLSDTGRRRIQVGSNVAELAAGEWSPWFREEVFGRPARFRVRALEDDRFYVTPFFSDPREPLHPFSSDPAAALRAIGTGMYVVEAAGWRIAADPELEDALVEHLRDVEQQHLDATRALARTGTDWSLLVHVMTLTDRTSHAFWRFGDESLIPEADPTEVAESRARLADAYRFADARIADLLALGGDDATVLVLSDHGSGPNSEPRWGGHRAEGIWIAAGPGIRPSQDRTELSIYDVTPTMLALFGMPTATDMDGRVAWEILDGQPTSDAIATYEVDLGDAIERVQVDSTTVEQLRSLGYVQ